VSDGKGRHKSQLAAKQRVQQLRVQQLRGELVTSEYSGRAAVFREELQSCRRTDPAILEERQRVKIQCKDSASVIVNCSEL
jgi:hypothetical protein